MKTLFILLVSLMISSFAKAKKYYTLSNGNWNNTTTVWSINNSTPCGCFPGYTISTDTLTINHPIALTGTVNSSAFGRIRVNSSGAITSTVSDLFVNNSVVLAYGAITVRSLNVGSGGLFSIQNASVFVNLNMDNYGSMLLDNAALHQLNGNMNIHPSATLQFANGAFYKSLLGNIKNEGSIQMCVSCCIELQKGNITNQSGATITGNGALNLVNGNIKNQGTFGSTLSYCSSGADQGMPIPENCIQAKQVCMISNSGLSTTLISFEGIALEAFNYLKWRSASESFQEMYLLERSTDGTNWNFLHAVPVTNQALDVNDYSYLDSLPITNLSYYRLSKLDENGTLIFQDQLSIRSAGDSRVTVFPNPTNSDIMVRFSHPTDYRSIELLDASGRTIMQIPLDESGVTRINLPAEKGNYFVQLNGNLRTSVFTIIKY